jgi:hypothetical protein
MPLATKNVSKGRVDFKCSLTRNEVDSLVSDAQLKILQTCDSVDDTTWEMLNERLFTLRPEVELRVYGFYSSECDLSFLAYLTNLHHFSADCLMRAKGIERVADLPMLESLSVGIDNLENFDFLANLSERYLRKLSLGRTKSKKPSLGHLKRFGELRRLYVEGQEKEIEAISKLSCLEDLTLRSITIGDLDFIRDLKSLWSLDIKLGGTNNLAALAGIDRIKYLELWQVRGLKDISVISTMRGLQYLFLQSLPHVANLPDFSNLRALRRVVLDSMKGLQDIRGLARAPALEEFMHIAAQGLEPTHYADLLTSKTLKRIGVGFGSTRKNKEFLDQARHMGIESYGRSQFVFA